MEVVRVFNNELSSLYEVRPPISKAKMTQITKSAIKGIKFYKHIVQSVEKFIQKCRPEYKIPGLYVVDSIVRQSRHQFGADKDVFGPRFVKNISVTFQHLFKCAEDDRPKIIRVLNLWQKNNVFPIDVIQPLMDMGHPNTSSETFPVHDEAQLSRHKSNDSNWKGWPQSNEAPSQENRTYAEITTTNLEKFTKAEMNNSVDEELSGSSLNRIHSKVEKPVVEAVKFKKELLMFDYGDEEDEEDAKNEDSHLSNQTNALAFSMAQNFLSDPEFMKKVEHVNNTLMSVQQQNETLNAALALQPQSKLSDNEVSFPADTNNSPHLMPPASFQQPALPHSLQLPQTEADKDDRVLPEPPMPPRDLDERSLASLLPSMCLAAFQQTGVSSNLPVAQSEADKDDRKIPEPAPMLPRDLDERSLASIIAPLERVIPTMPYTEGSNVMYSFDKNSVPFPPPPNMQLLDSMSVERSFPQVGPPDQNLVQNCVIDEDERVMFSMPGEPPLPSQDFDERNLMLPVEDRSRKDRSRSRSGSRSRGRSGKHRSRSRSPRRKRSRSRSRSRKNRSRSRDRERVREKERERERERDRRRKGLPPIKKGFVSVCSTTIWLGHVPKSCSENAISDLFSPYGNILSIDMIPPRGCAFVVMERRQDGHRAIQKLKNVKLQTSTIKIAWAPGKGVKGIVSKDWEVESGVSYVPYEKMPETPDALTLLEEGGFIDEDSLPENLKTLRKLAAEGKDQNKAGESSVPYNEVPTAPNMVPPPAMPPTTIGLPMVLPHLMQPQFGLHLPGLLPPQAMVMQVPMGIPPPNPMLMVQQQAQNILSNQQLPMVGSVPQMVSRALPPVPSMQSLKNVSRTEHVLGSPMVVVPTSGDATPTEEDGTSVSSPCTVSLPVSSSVSSISIASSQSAVSLSQFNPQVGMHNVTRPNMSVPPPVSTACAPIPYPPPNVNFNFPPPGVRPPGQNHNMFPNPQFPWMQNPANSAESGQNPSLPRPLVNPQSGTPMHMYGDSRHPFHESPASSQPASQKDRDNNLDRKPNDIDSLGSRSMSPSHDKSIQEMVISTDDESSMDQDYPRIDVSTGPGQRYGVTEFPRLPMNMPRMRGPPAPMPGARFPRGMPIGSSFPMRMGGPRPIGGHNMHPRMDMDFPGHPGPRGLRLPAGTHAPRRNDNMHPRNNRDWYNRDFDDPPFERERDRHYHNEWNRDSWVTHEDLESNSAHLPREQDESRHEDHRHHDGPSNTDSSTQGKDSNTKETLNTEKNDSRVKQGKKVYEKPKVSKSLMHDMFKLQFYQRDQKPNIAILNKKMEERLKNSNSKAESSKDNSSSDAVKDNSSSDAVKDDEKKSANDAAQTETFSANTKKDKDREARKKSRWGRTLSEEREFQELQQQKRNEIEMKFQSYEQSHAAQQPPAVDSANTVSENESTAEPLSENNVQETPSVSECDIVNTPIHLDSSDISHVQNNEISATDVPDNSTTSALNENVSSVQLENVADLGESDNISSPPNAEANNVESCIAENHLSDTKCEENISDLNPCSQENFENLTEKDDTEASNMRNSPLVTAES